MSLNFDLSEYYMWKTAIGLIYVDGPFNDPEKRWLLSHLKKLKLPQTQIQELRTFLFVKPPDYVAAFGCVEFVRDREKLLKLAEIIFKIDKNVSAKEEAAMTRLLAIHERMNKASGEIYKDIATEMIKSLKTVDRYRKIEQLGRYAMVRAGWWGRYSHLRPSWLVMWPFW
jgi:hypothetical protein